MNYLLFLVDIIKFLSKKVIDLHCHQHCYCKPFFIANLAAEGVLCFLNWGSLGEISLSWSVAKTHCLAIVWTLRVYELIAMNWGCQRPFQFDLSLCGRCWIITPMPVLWGTQMSRMCLSNMSVRIPIRLGHKMWTELEYKGLAFCLPSPARLGSPWKKGHLLGMLQRLSGFQNFAWTPGIQISTTAEPE